MTESCGVSRATLSRKFKVFFENHPHPIFIWKISPPLITKLGAPWVYGFDGKWLGRGTVILIHRDVTNRQTLWWSMAASESIAAFSSDIRPFSHITKNNPPIGTISDWKPGIVRVMGETWKGIPQQRCLVHIERDLKRLLPAGSPLVATRQLRIFATIICHIKTPSSRDKFTSQLLVWHTRYGELLTERTTPKPGTTTRRWWYTHGNLRKAWRILIHNQDSLFRYLESPLLPTTNNSLEGINSHLARRRGLSKDYQVSLMFWQLALSRCATPQLRRQLWDIWKQVVSAGQSTQNAT